jgi:Zn-dependent protease
VKSLKTISSIDSAFNLGTISGIQFRIHYSWFIIFVLVTYSLSVQYFPDIYPQWHSVTYWTIGTISSLLFFTSVIAHELAHSFVARTNGIPVKSITLFIFGGVAQITRDATKARAELVMAAAGPAASLVISGVCGMLWFVMRSLHEPTAAILFWLAQVNVTLAVFNLIPGYPLDGGRIFHSILWRTTGKYHRSTRIAALVGRIVGYLFIVGGILVMFFFHDWFSGVWLAFIGWFLASTAFASYRQVRWRERLAAFTAAKVMTSNYRVVPPDITLEQLIREQLIINEHLLFLVTDNGRLKGTATLASVQAIPQQRWGTTQVKDIMFPVLQIAHPDQDALSIMEQMDANELNQVPVISEGRVVGVIARDNLLNLLELQSESGT